MRFKSSVEVKTYKPETWRMIFWFQDIRQSIVGNEIELVITSGNDGKHRDGSEHYKDEAFDARSHDLDHQTKLQVLEKAREEFAKDTDEANVPLFTIIIEDLDGENEHFHLQVGAEGIRKYW